MVNIVLTFVYTDPGDLILRETSMPGFEDLVLCHAPQNTRLAKLENKITTNTTRSGI